MYRRDFHGWKPEDAEREVDRIVSAVRLEETSEAAEFITGRGVIQKQILQQLTDYSLKPVVQWGNDGVISVVII